jgi:membrane associated rhomboid family serine protease
LDSQENKSRILKSLLIPAGFIVLLWIILFAQEIFNLNFPYEFGLYPRKLSGLIGVITSPLIHGGYAHLLSNSLPVFLLAAGIIYFYPEIGYKAIIIIYIFTGLLVWLLARSVYHIGASGLIYGFASFLFFSGVFKRDNRSIGLALLVTFVYGGMVWGILPGQPGISWESHFLGGIMGLVCAFIFRKKDKHFRYDWEEEENEIPPNKLEISYDNKKFENDEGNSE